MAHNEIKAVCPDDLSEITYLRGRWCCSRCARDFPLVDGILELLPAESFREGSLERAQLEQYAASFSERPERAWFRPLRLLFAHLGNGYLYNWAWRRLEAMSRGRSLSVLDAACGDGILCRFLSHRHSYLGVDFSTRLLRRAHQYCSGTYYRADLNHLPFLDSSFDAIVSLQALQYLQRPELALQEMARVLRPGGTLLLSVPNDESFKYRFQGIPKIQLQRFSQETLLPLLPRNFEILEMKARGFWLPFPKLSVHLPGIYPAHWGLAWTILAKH